MLSYPMLDRLKISEVKECIQVMLNNEFSATIGKPAAVKKYLTFLFLVGYVWAARK